MDWQYGVVAVIVLAAVGYLARQSWRTWRGTKAGCGGGCACPGKRSAAGPAEQTFIPAEDLAARLRRRE